MSPCLIRTQVLVGSTYAIPHTYIPCTHTYCIDTYTYIYRQNTGTHTYTYTNIKKKSDLKKLLRTNGDQLG